MTGRRDGHQNLRANGSLIRVGTTIEAVTSRRGGDTWRRHMPKSVTGRRVRPQSPSSYEKHRTFLPLLWMQHRAPDGRRGENMLRRGPRNLAMPLRRGIFEFGKGDRTSRNVRPQMRDVRPEPTARATGGVAIVRERLEQFRGRMKCAHTGCTREPAKGRKTCQRCRDLAFDNAMATYSIRRVNGLCVKCGVNRTEKFARCRPCRQARNEADAKRSRAKSAAAVGA